MKSLSKRLILPLGRISLAVAIGLTVGTVANQYGHNPVVQVKVDDGSNPPLSESRWQWLWQSLRSVTDREPNWTEWIAMCENGHPNELARVLDRLDEIPNPEMRTALKAVALRRWFDLDAKAAWAYATERAKRENSSDWLVDALFQWAELDGPRAREALAETTVPSNWKTHAEISLVMATAMNDPEAALQLAQEVGAAEHVYEDLFGRLCAQNLKKAVSLAEMMPTMPASSRQSAILAVSAEWARVDGPSALAWLDEQNSNQAQAKLVAGMIWSAHDPEAVLTQLDTLALYPESRGPLMGKALFEWWKRDATAAQAWFDQAELTREEAESVQLKLIESLAQHDPESAAALSDQATAAGFPSNHWIAAKAWAENDPEAALAWAESLPAGESRDLAVLQICQRLMERDPGLVLEVLPDLAERFAESHNTGMLADRVVTALSGRGEAVTRRWLDRLPEDVRSSFWKAYALNWGARDPDSVLNYFSSQKSERHLVEAVQEVISRWASREPEAAAERIVTLSDMEMRELATNNVLGAWLPTDPARAESWAIELADPAMRDQAFWMLADHWSVTSPERAFVLANGIEDTDLRYESVKKMVRQVVLDRPDLAAKFIERANLAPEEKERLTPR